MPDVDAGPREDAELARAVGVRRVLEYEVVRSTQDVAHELGAAESPDGVLVWAHEQTAGRGRMGRSWQSERDRGVWFTLFERPTAADALDVLSLRVGVAIADVVDAMAPARVGLKWPNDLMIGDRKLGGILIEARWRGRQLDWVAIGVGINRGDSSNATGAIGLDAAVDVRDVLRAVVPPIRRAAARSGSLASDELSSYAARDVARGRRCREPVAGIVEGIDPSGALLIASASGLVAARSGSLVFDR